MLISSTKNNYVTAQYGQNLIPTATQFLKV